MTSAGLITDAFGRIRETVTDTLYGLTAEQLTYRADANANPIAWLIWHLTRVQDDHVAAAFGVPQVWTDGGWAARFGTSQKVALHGASAVLIPPDGHVLFGFVDLLEERLIHRQTPFRCACAQR